MNRRFWHMTFPDWLRTPALLKDKRFICYTDRVISTSYALMVDLTPEDTTYLVLLGIGLREETNECILRIFTEEYDKYHG